MSSTKIEFARVAIVGVGLIGGSIALAAKKLGAAETVIGYGRNQDRLVAAQNRGVIDKIATTPEALRNADLIVVCTPVDRIAEDVLTILRATEETPALVTDAGSVKSKIQEVVSKEYTGDRYIGAHPLAGSHHTGFEHASADLFQNRLCIVCPKDYPKISCEAERVSRFWKQIGMKVRMMPAERHDYILAVTSHLPHLTASAMASIVDPHILEFAASGYRDTTRVAAGDPDLWAAIFELNSTKMVHRIDSLLKQLRSYKEALVKQDKEKLQQLLKRGALRRKQYRDDFEQTDNET